MTLDCLVIVVVLLLAAALSSPWSTIRDGLACLFKSDTRAFFGGCMLFKRCNYHLAAYIAHALVTISAGTLVKLDAQTAGL